MQKKEAVSKVSFDLDTEFVEVGIWLIIRCRFDRCYNEFIELLNDQPAVMRQLPC